MLVDEALKARPEVAALEAQLRAQEATVTAARGGWFPSLGVSAGMNDIGTGLDGPDATWNWNAGATLNWNLFQGGMTSSLVREAQAGAGVDAGRSWPRSGCRSGSSWSRPASPSASARAKLVATERGAHQRARAAAAGRGALLRRLRQRAGAVGRPAPGDAGRAPSRWGPSTSSPRRGPSCWSRSAAREARRWAARGVPGRRRGPSGGPICACFVQNGRFGASSRYTLQDAHRLQGCPLTSPPAPGAPVNDTYKQVKDWLRTLDTVLTRGGNSNRDLAQAVSMVHRLVKKGDRSREPSPEILRSLDKAEALGRTASA